MTQAGAELAQLVSLGADYDAQLAARWRVLPLFREDAPEARLKSLAPGIRLLVTSARVGVGAETLQVLPHLQAICSWGVGCDALPLEAARERQIVVSNTPDVLTECVADMAWGLLLASARQIPAGDRYARSGSWVAQGKFPLSTRVWGRRLGILGMGRIGEAIARRGQGFGMTTRYHNRRPRTDLPDYGYEPSLAELARWADFLVVACPGGAATRHLVDAPVLQALGPQGLLVNIARGSVVDESALIPMLQSGALGGAGLDVFEHEPGVPAGLAAVDRVALTPHAASSTRDTAGRMSQLVVDNLIAWQDQRHLLTPVA
ncbi:2-hydroxyacid dehydrogenase [Castellaniella sp.]|uniref:2-hydroxyacid dehydrogenase n=1 Tax=Castellaniella sp. TaxID=1955812 RepID=UPI002AFEA876|nr:2-hydroxyacid dehydrogenase [Castellaniella sp.]